MIATVVLGAQLAACGGSSDGAGGDPVAPPPPPASSPTRVTASPSVTNIDVGTTLAASAVVIGSKSDTLGGYTPAWTSADASVASVTAAGAITALGVGGTFVRATAAGLTDSVRVNVTAPLPVGSRFVQVAVKRDHACGLTDAGVTYCWGTNSSLQADPSGSGSPVLTPHRVPGAPVFTSLVPGTDYTCGLTGAGDLYCWGQTPYPSANATPQVRPFATGLGLTQAVAGKTHLCGLTSGGDIYCLGKNTDGQLGIGGASGSTSSPTYPDASVLTKVAGTQRWIAVSASETHTCALAADSTAYCWGSNSTGQIGAGLGGSVPSVGVPTAVASSIHFASITAGPAYSISCGIKAGTTYCWGAGPFALNPQVGRSTPEEMTSKPQFESVSGGFAQLCGLSAHTAYCWGQNNNGSLGLGVAGASYVGRPAPTAGGMQFTQLSAGVTSACAVTTGGRIACWGAGATGILGNGDTSDRSSPTLTAPAP